MRQFWLWVVFFGGLLILAATAPMFGVGLPGITGFASAVYSSPEEILQYAEGTGFYADFGERVGVGEIKAERAMLCTPYSLSRECRLVKEEIGKGRHWYLRFAGEQFGEKQYLEMVATEYGAIKKVHRGSYIYFR